MTGAIPHKSTLTLFLFCAAFALLATLRLNELSLYNPDSTRYLIWGNSLAQGKGFIDATQPEADRYVIHAPLYALLIAPVEFFAPNSLIAVKIESILWGIASMVLLYFWLNGLLGSFPALMGVFIFACNPLFLLYSTEVLSEVPFVTLMLAVLILSDRVLHRAEHSKRTFFLLLLCLSLLALLREAGIALVGACAFTFFVHRQPRRAAILVLGSGLLLGLWFLRNQIIVTPSEGSQAGNATLIFQHFATPGDAPIILELVQRGWLQGKEYFFQLGGMLFYPQFETQQISLVLEPSGLFMFFQSAFSGLKYLVATGGLILFAVGFYADFKKSSNAVLRCSFGISFLFVIFLYPVHDVRFLFPLLPLMIFYLLFGAKVLFRHKISAPRQANYAISFAAVTVLLLPNLTGMMEIILTNLEYRTSPVMFFQKLSKLRNYPPLFAQPWPLLAEWIKKHTPDDVVIASSAKDIATMIGGRKILELDPGVPLPEFERILRDYSVTYIIAPVRWEKITAYEFLTGESHRFSFETVCSVSNLRLLKLQSRFQAAPAPDSLTEVYSDTMTAGGLLKYGRSNLITGRYDEARRVFSGALRLAPDQPDLLYQFAVACSFKGDTANAIQSFQSLLTLPQAGSFLYSTRKLIEAMQLHSGYASAPGAHEIRTQEAAAIYWNLGYRKRASELMDASLMNNSQYFVGLLWGLHYSLQQGETSMARRYLQRLQRIDSANVVVEAFREILLINDTLALSGHSPARSELHLRTARLYRQIELNEEAIDEAERAVGEKRKNREAISFLVELFTIKKSPRARLFWLRNELELDPSNHLIRTKVDSLRNSLNP